jgi:hypothetical protein
MSRTTSDYPTFWERQLNRLLDSGDFELELHSAQKAGWLAGEWPDYAKRHYVTGIQVFTKGSKLCFQLLYRNGDSND